jgi:hypothetical protein
MAIMAKIKPGSSKFCNRPRTRIVGPIIASYLFAQPVLKGFSLPLKVREIPQNIAHSGEIRDK